MRPKTNQLLFTSDWQFGPEWTMRHDPVDIDEFWQVHDAKELLLNVAYPIVSAAELECNESRSRIS